MARTGNRRVRRDAQAGAARRAHGWRVLAAVLVAAAGGLLAAAAASLPDGGWGGNAGAVSAAGFVAEDRRRLSAETDQVRAERTGLAGGPAVAGSSPSSTSPSVASPAADPPTSPTSSISPTVHPSTTPPVPSGPVDPRARRADLAAQIGLTAVRGPAVTVELDDAPRESRGGPLAAGVPSPGPNDLVVHQQDVQAVVNALWSGGAEAMAVMGHRVTPRTAVRCVGNTLLLEGRVYSPPFRISAIGDQAGLRNALDTDPGVALYREYVAAYGLGYRVTSDTDLVLPAHTGEPLV